MTVPSLRYEKEHGVEKTIEIDEALSEAMSHVLAKELSVKLGIPQGVEIIEDVWRKVQEKERYKLTVPALKLVQTIGMGNAFSLYMEDPEKFEKALDM